MSTTRMSHRAGRSAVALAALFCNFVRMPPVRLVGTSIATAASVRRLPSVWWRRASATLGCAIGLSLGGCLITDPAQIEDPLNSPPAIRSSPEAASDNVAMNQILRLSYAEDGEVEIPIIVRDENVLDALVVQVWIDFVPGVSPNQFSGAPLYPDPLPVLTSTGSPDREHAVLIPHSLFGPADACHRVEVFVTRRFAPTAIPHRQPETSGDIGTATFWVAMSNTGTNIDMRGCP
jgi:hypothetical protein